ncbi:unnamed protein product [Orchesella dallaii]|uniref:Ionotropic glutamate receptor C-terminal domain-containing protein n=1 Tax=Orchesella dallaii TaxID=48710 RepID=A0ABP1RG11_9HEXA
MWVLAVSAITCIMALMYVGRYPNPCFYTLSLLLEQGSANLQKKYFVTMSVTMLLFLSYMLRIAYTSSMYSYFTVEPEIIVPQSFEESVQNDNYFKVAELHNVKDIFSKMSYAFNTTTKSHTVTNSTPKVLEGLSKKIYGLKLFPSFMSQIPKMYLGDAQLTSLAKRINTLFVEKLCASVWINPRQFMNFPTTLCGNRVIEANRFVYIYNFPDRARNGRVGVDIFAAILFGNKKIFANNNPAMFYTVYGWSQTYDLGTIMADDIIGKLGEAGILSRWRKLKTLFVLLNSWKRILGWKAFRGRVRYNIVQLAYDLIEDFSLVENIEKGVSNARDLAATNRTLATVWTLFFVSIALSSIVFIWEREKKIFTCVSTGM